MAASVVITDLGDKVRISGMGTPSKITFPKDSTVYTRQNTGISGSEEYFRLYSHGRQTLDLKASDILTPTVADADALEGVLEAYFFSVTSYDHTSLLAAITAGTLPNGEHIFVTGPNMADRGIWLFCTSTNTVSEDGEGVYQDAVWVDGTQGDSSDIEVLTGFDPTAFTGQWATPPLPLPLLVFVGLYTIVGSLWVVGVTIIEDQHGWTGTVGDYENGNLSATTITGTIPTVGDTIGNADMYATVTSIYDYNGIVLTYIDPSAANLGYRMFQITDYTAITADPPTISPGYTELHRKTMRINYDTLDGGVFVVGSTVVDAGTGANGKVLQDDGAIIYIQPLDNVAWAVNNLLYDGGDVSARMRVINDSLNLGYIETSCPISFDVTNGWIFNRKQGTVDITTTFEQYGAATYSILSFPWGNYIIEQFVCKGKYLVHNTLATLIANWDIGIDSIVQAEIFPEVTFKNLTIANGQSWVGYDVAGNIDGMLVDGYNENYHEQPITGRTHDIYGNDLWITEITNTDLNDNIGDGIMIASDFVFRFKKARVTISYFLGGFSTYLPATSLVIVDGTGLVTLGTAPAALLTSAFGSTLEIELDFNQLGIGEFSGLWLTTATNLNYTGGDPFNSMVITVVALT